MNLESIHIFLKTDLGLLLVGFFLTGVVGAFLNERYQLRTWQREKKHQLLARALENGRDLYDEISDALTSRSHGLFRLLKALKASQVGVELDDCWDAYYESVKVWNRKLYALRFRIEAIAGEELAKKLYDYEDTATSASPHSVHYMLRTAHLEFQELYEAQKISGGIEELGPAQDHLERLQGEIELFLKALSQSLLYTEKTLDELVSGKPYA